MTGLQSPTLPKGYQFDYINAEVLLLNANVAQGNIILPHGTSYKVLVLPPVKSMRPELLEKIQRLVKDGAIVLGEAPTHSPSLKDYPASDAKIEKMARELWGEAFDKRGSNKYGKGCIYNGYSLEEVFAQMGLTPDCATRQSDPVLFNHRSTMGAEIYFISNQSNHRISINPTFRVDRTLRPEFWDAVDGSIRTLPEFEVVDGGITLPISLEALGSGFIVFRSAAKVPTTEQNFPAATQSVELTAPWHVEFEGKLSSHEPITLQRLEDFSLSEDKDLKYFSGTMNYTTEFSCEDTSGQIRLNLGRVESMAKVYVNDQLAGGAWCAPYSVNISQYVQQGKNTLRVEVVNKWVNRIVGDLQLPAEERKISLTANPYNASSAIPASGLIGKAELLHFNE